MREYHIDVRAGPHRAREDQVDGSSSRGKRVIDDRLGEEAADEPGPGAGARRMQEDKGTVALQLPPDGPEALVAGQLVPVAGVRADAAAELLLGEEEVDLGAGAPRRPASREARRRSRACSRGGPLRSWPGRRGLC